MKTYKRGLITGILLTVSAFVFMGHSNRWEDNSLKIGMYQATSVALTIPGNTKKIKVFTTIIDTRTGTIKNRNLAEEYNFPKYR